MASRKSKTVGSLGKIAQSVHKIGLYIRVSTEEQAENPEGSIKNQEERLRSTVQFKNQEGAFGEVTEVFIDRARSGKDTNRPELQRLLSMIRRREITLVMASELSRLSRSIKDFSEIWELMRSCGCGFQSLRENFDTTTAAGEMVLYTVANIAQFERRQVSERVSANFQARAARGLYNGGVLPLGYRLIEGKSGHLEIDPVGAKTVQLAFKTFLREGSISRAARWLNLNGHVLKRETVGGNHKGRLGYFTFGNLQLILTNRAYLGLRRFTLRGEVKEAKACWPQLIDNKTFERVAKQLKSNSRHRKPDHHSRYPFLLTGFVNCAACGARMVGKSAHGKCGKVPYYEHGWAARRQSCLVKKVCNCTPFRVQAKKLEPALWQEIEKILKNPKMAKELLDKAREIHGKKSKSQESKRTQERLRGLHSQMEVLAERLAQLPKSVSPLLVFKQMEKLEALKADEEKRLSHLQQNEVSRDLPAEFSSYQELLKGLRQLAVDPKATNARERIVRSLVQRIEITPSGFNVSFHGGRDHMEGELATLACSPFSLVQSSNRLTNGGPKWTSFELLVPGGSRG